MLQKLINFIQVKDMNTFNKQIISQAIPATLLLLAIYSVLPFTRAGIPMVSTLNNTTLWWGISFLILIAFFLSRYYFFDKKNEDNMLIVWLYLLWNIVCIIRGAVGAEIYWDWKALIGNGLGLVLPIVIFTATNKVVVQSLLSFYIKYGLPLFLLFALIINISAYGFYLMPISFLILYFPLLTKRQKIVLLVATAIVIVGDLNARSNVVKFAVPILILLFYYFKRYVSLKMMETVRISLFIFPLLFFILGVTGIFNIFNIQEHLDGDYTAMGVDSHGNMVEQNVIEDTRTFIYDEVLVSAVENNYWLLGRTPARGNDSESFGMYEAEYTGRYERSVNEIGLANIFTWTGVTGVILYSLIFLRASFLAVNRSRNIYSKMLGVYVAFRWLFSWIEDVNNFSINYFLLMVMIGICFSYSFRNMNDKEVLIWARGIFDVRYIRLQQYLVKKEKNEKRNFGGLADLSQQEK